jgi:methionyl-tRNA formyltransferase
MVGVVTPEKKPIDVQATYQPLLQLAEKNKIPTFQTSDINSEETIKSLSKLSPDLAIVAGWSKIISKEVLDIPKKGTVGLHSAMLPKGRGGAPVNWSIIHDEPEIGITLYYLDGGVDSGDIVSQRAVKINDTDDVKSVFEKLTLVAKEMVVTAVSFIEDGTAPRKKQDLKEATYRPRRYPDDGLIIWEKKSRDLFNWIRALTHPYPGAFTYRNRKKLFVWKSELIDLPGGKWSPGGVVEVKEGRGMVAKTGDGTILLTQVQEEGKSEMRADEYFAQGGLRLGEILGKKEDFPPIIFANILGEKFNTTSYPTNVGKSEQRHIVARIENYSECVPIEICAYLDDKQIFQQSVIVSKFECRDTKINFSVPTRGTHTLAVIFKKEGEVINKRYLKVFVLEG